MYLDFYGLSGEPFRLTPDARFFYESRTHRKALAYLAYGLGKAEGFVVMTGEIGAGKTTMLEHLRASLTDPAIATGWIVTSQVEADDLLRLVASAFRLFGSETDKGTLIRRIEAFLIACREQGRRACLIVDEAQSLSMSSLEELRMLSNLHGTGSALLQIVLVGQPDFRTLLQMPQLEQLRQRVIVSGHLPALDEDETGNYIGHRLRCVNWRDDPSFSEGALQRVHAVTGGLPRRINLLCDRLLLLGFLDGKHHLTEDDVAIVVAEYQEEITGVTPPAAAPAAANGSHAVGSEPPAPRLHGQAKARPPVSPAVSQTGAPPVVSAASPLKSSAAARAEPAGAAPARGPARAPERDAAALLRPASSAGGMVAAAAPGMADALARAPELSPPVGAYAPGEAPPVTDAGGPGTVGVPGDAPSGNGAEPSSGAVSLDASEAGASRTSILRTDLTQRAARLPRADAWLLLLAMGAVAAVIVLAIVLYLLA